MKYEILISFISASIALTIMPGPDIIYVLLQSVSNGKKYGIVASLGLVSGIIVHTTLVAFGVSALINQSPKLLLLLKIIGAAYLLYLAFKSYFSSEEINIQNKVKKRKVLSLFKQGFIMNVVNPKVSIFFLAFFPGFLYSDTQNTVMQFYVLGALFMIQALLIFSIVSISSGYFSNYIQNHPKMNANIKWAKVLVFIGIACFILIS